MTVWPHYLKTVENFEPFTKVLKGGVALAELKESIVNVLNPCVRDKEILWRQAVSVLANEALRIANLNVRTEWKDLLVRSFEMRDSAILKDKLLACKIVCDFEFSIREAQRKYSMQILLGQSKGGLSAGEYAFEMFRLMGGLIESTIQPFVKEIYCLAALNAGPHVDTKVVIEADFGRVIEKFGRLNCFPGLLTPRTWGVRINQWRNIAQHHSFGVVGEKIEATYGKSSPKKCIALTREELFSFSKAIIRRLGALKSSRELNILNNIEELRGRLPNIEADIYSKATELASAFSTQGFTLAGREEAADVVSARIIDVNSSLET